MSKDLIILRAVPGAGKITLASLFDNPIICYADDWFFETYGEYKWSYADAGKAHAWCREKCETAMKDEHPVIVIANTNTTEKEWRPYFEMGKKFGYRIHTVIVENRHGGKNEHGVPEESLTKMEARIKSDLKLR